MRGGSSGSCVPGADACRPGTLAGEVGRYGRERHRGRGRYSTNGAFIFQRGDFGFFCLLNSVYFSSLGGGGEGEREALVVVCCTAV